MEFRRSLAASFLFRFVVFCNYTLAVRFNNSLVTNCSLCSWKLWPSHPSRPCLPAS